MHIIQLSLTMFPHKIMFYFLVKHVLFPARTFSFIINDVFENRNDNIRSETTELTKRKSAEVFNIRPRPSQAMNLISMKETVANVINNILIWTIFLLTARICLKLIY